MGVSARMWRWCRRLRLRLALLAILLVLLRPRRFEEGRGRRRVAPEDGLVVQDDEPESLSLEDALKLLSLRANGDIRGGTNAETGEVSECTVAANNGRYGPYLTKTGADGKSETRSLASEDEIFTVDIDKAKELFSQPKYGRGRGRGRRQAAAA